MYILIFEPPPKVVEKGFIRQESRKINLGRSLRDGYGNIQMSTDFYPDYIG